MNNVGLTIDNQAKNEHLLRFKYLTIEPKKAGEIYANYY